MTTTPSPGPQPGSLVIEGPLFVFPDGSWGVLISVLALTVSAITLWYTLSAKSRVRGHVQRGYVMVGAKAMHDGDEVVIVNLGRSAAIVYDVRALTEDGRRLKAASMSRGTENKTVLFPPMPQTLDKGAVLPVWFSTALAGERAGRDHGYVITYTDTGGWGRRVGTQKELTVKATSETPPEPRATA
jgi:hypothetical protein